MNDIIRKAFSSAGIKLAGVACTFAFLLIAARATEPEEYGRFAAVFSLATILGFAFVAGQNLVLVRFWPAIDELRSRGAAEAALVWTLKRLAAACLVGSVLLLAIHYGWRAIGSPPEVLDYPGALLAMTLAFATSEFAQAALRARGEVVVSLSGREVLWRVISIGAILAIGMMSGEQLVYLSAATLFAINLLQFWLVRRQMAEPEALPEIERLEMRKTVPWLWFGSLGAPISQHAGTVVVGLILGPVAAGAFFAADRLAKLIAIALMAANQVFGPELSREFHAGRHEQVRVLMTVSTLLAGGIALAGLIGLVVLGKFALSLFDPLYRDAYTALVVLALGYTFNAACGPNIMLLNMAGLERATSLIVAGWGVLTPLLLWLGAANSGIVGAAIAATSVIIGWNVFAVILSWRKLRIVPWHFGVLRRYVAGRTS